MDNELHISGCEIIREIYRGGIGVIYLTSGYNNSASNNAAIKIARQSNSTKESEFINSRITNEHAILSELDHPQIVKYYENGTTDTGLAYFLMEYIEGIRFDRYCDENRLSVTDRLKLFQIICNAVDYSHTRYVIHCDIKPSNILVSKEGIPKLLDFSIAQPALENAHAGLNGGRPGFIKVLDNMNGMLLTPEYAGPEQICGENLTPAADQYNLGILLYELLTGRRPYSFHSQSYVDMADIICNVVPLEPSEMIRIIPDDEIEPAITYHSTNRDDLIKVLKGGLDSIVMKSLSKYPQDRYSSVAELSKALSNLNH